jgi:hypothetical protein
MNEVAEGLTILLSAMILTAVGFEINRRRKLLSEIYNVLDSETRHITAQLEDMVREGTLQPYTGDAPA